MDNDTDNGNDLTQPEQRDTPGGEAAGDAERSWTSVLASDGNQVAVGGAIMALGYGAKMVADKFRKPPPPPPAPPTPPPGSSASDGGA